MNTTLFKKLLAITVLTFGSLAVIGCNTMDGAGKDIERAGEEIQDAAR